MKRCLVTMAFLLIAAAPSPADEKKETAVDPYDQSKVPLEAHDERDECEDDDDAADFPDQRLPGGNVDSAAQADQRIYAQIKAEQECQDCVNYPAGTQNPRPNCDAGRCHD